MQTPSQRNLELTRPLVAFDLETTGLDINTDRIVEISCIKLSPDGSREVKTKRINPTIPIAAAATAVHGITDADVQDAPTFKQIARALFDFLNGCDLTGFNIEGFDLPLLRKEFERVGIVFPSDGVFVLDSWRIFLQREPRDLTAAYRFYCHKDLQHAHSAEADATAAADILLAQIARYEDMPLQLDALYAHCKDPTWIDNDGKLMWRNDEAVMGFGKHKHRLLKEMVQNESGYLQWMAASNFSPTVVDIIKAAFRGEFPKR